MLANLGEQPVGSPPRGRGKVDSLSRQLTGSGITPAWAGKSKEPLKICEKQEDHPRVGGEKLDLLAVVFSALGSPPRGRGKDVDWLGFNQFFRITPAWAGKSGYSSTAGSSGKDHPRVGGEKTDFIFLWRMVKGSPPRGRGKAVYFCHLCPQHRITPAWAGKSIRAHNIPTAEMDHPRVGGEKRGLEVCRQTGRGSPPHGRGKVFQYGDAVGKVGITPAWAGKSGGDIISKIIVEDHPRMGGEKASSVRSPCCCVGSPPHGRGKGLAGGKAKRPDRITPAWAGKSTGCTRCRRQCGDHPRMGGEKPSTFVIFAHSIGSPPHGRGKDAHTGAFPFRLRITPAWAGKRFTTTDTIPVNGDHPRMGGEKVFASIAANPAIGSPPHGRGKDKNDAHI